MYLSFRLIGKAILEIQKFSKFDFKEKSIMEFKIRKKDNFNCSYRLFYTTWILKNVIVHNKSKFQVNSFSRSGDSAIFDDRHLRKI